MKKHITRSLRRTQTPWERKLWQALRNRGVANLKFRRQYKIGNYIVDFVCLSEAMVIELDGGHHNETIQKEKDQARQQFIEAQGFKVLRFWNNDIDESIDSVIGEIINNLKP